VVALFDLRALVVDQSELGAGGVDESEARRAGPR